MQPLQYQPTHDIQVATVAKPNERILKSCQQAFHPKTVATKISIGVHCVCSGVWHSEIW